MADLKEDKKKSDRLHFGEDRPAEKARRKKGVERLQDVAERAVERGEEWGGRYASPGWEQSRAAGDPGKRGTVDRIEGDFAVVEDANGNFVNVPLRLLPEGIREGSPAEWKE